MRHVYINAKGQAQVMKPLAVMLAETGQVNNVRLSHKDAHTTYWEFFKHVPAYAKEVFGGRGRNCDHLPWAGC